MKSTATQESKQLRPRYFDLPESEWTDAERAREYNIREDFGPNGDGTTPGFVVAEPVAAIKQAEEKEQAKRIVDPIGKIDPKDYPHLTGALKAKQPEHTRTGNCWAFGLMEISNCTQHGKARGNCVECPPCPACSKEAVRSTEEICDDVMDHAYRLIDAGEAVEQPADAFPSHARRGERQYVIHGGKPLQIRPLVDEPAESIKPDGGEYLLGWVYGVGQCGELWKADIRAHQEGCPATCPGCVPDDCTCGLSKIREEAVLDLQDGLVGEQPAPVAEDIAPRFQNAAAFMSNLEDAAEGEASKTGWDAIEGLIGSVDGAKTGEEGKAALSLCPFCRSAKTMLWESRKDEAPCFCGFREECQAEGPHAVTHNEAVALWNRRASVDPSSLSAERCYQVFRQIKWKGQDDWIISNATGEGKFILSWRGNARFIYDLEAARVIAAWFLSHGAVKKGVK